MKTHSVIMTGQEQPPIKLPSGDKLENTEIKLDIFLKIDPREYLRHDMQPMIIRLTDVRKCFINPKKEQFVWSSRDEKEMQEITVVMKDGTIYERYFVNMAHFNQEKNTNGKRIRN